jgi:alpha-beta hydrolase superfamily lysophospholipase
VLSGTSAADVIAGAIDTTQPADLAAFNAGFEPARTGYEWLSRDEAEVDAYVADPDCGFALDVPAMGEMVAGGAGTADPTRLRAIRDDLPIYLFSGDADPLAGGGALVQLVGDRYREAGVRDVTVTLYPGARHETLNETNRDEVTADLLAWLDRVVTA